MFQDMMAWFRDWQGMRDLDEVWGWVRNLLLYYWSTHPIMTAIVVFVFTVVILTGTARFKLFGNSLLTIVTTVVTSIITFIFQTVLQKGGAALIALVVSSAQWLMKDKADE